MASGWSERLEDYRSLGIDSVVLCFDWGNASATETRRPIVVFLVALLRDGLIMSHHRLTLQYVCWSGHEGARDPVALWRKVGDFL